MNEANIRIASSFKLGPHTYKVIQDKGLCARDGLLGQHKVNARIIRLQSKEEILNYPDSEYQQTYYHEKVHAILSIMGENDLTNNEKFVDLFATLLLQSDLTSEFLNEHES